MAGRFAAKRRELRTSRRGVTSQTSRMPMPDANGMTIETMWSPSASYANYGMSEESSYPGDELCRHRCADRVQPDLESDALA